jgi:hypothetical protein
MSLEEAEWIARNRLPDEPSEDEVASWQAHRPRPEPRRETRSLDTAPAPPQIDWADVIRRAILAERSVMSEIVGSAIGEIRNETLDEVEGMIAAAVNQLRAELRVEFSRQLDGLRGQIDAQGNELRSRLEEVIAKKRRTKDAAKPNGSLLQLRPPNGDARPQ